MSVSRASASRAVVAAVLVFGGLAAAPGAAQVAVPMSPSEQPPAPAPVPADVRIDRLTTVDVDSTGVLTAEQGGFGASMWRGTGRSVVEALLPRLPVDTGSRAMRDLMRRLLLSAAGAPEGEATPGSLVALRARMLLAMGDLGGVEALLAATSTRVADPDLAQIRVDALLLSGDNAGACAVAERRMDAAVAVYWQKVLIFCQALAGEHDKAALGVALLGEMGEPDPTLAVLVAALGGEGGRIEALPDPTPLYLAMARAAKVELPADVAASDRLAVLRAIAVSPNASTEVRLAAADRAQAAGALAADTLRQLYAAVVEQPAASGAQAAPEGGGGPRGRAFLFRGAVAAATPEARAEAIAKALKAGREQGRYGATVQVYLPLLEATPPSPETVGLAAEAIPALLVAGKRETADAWLAFLNAAAGGDPRAAAARVAVTPLVHLVWTADSEGGDTADLAAWWRSIRDTEGAAARAILVYALLDAADVAVADSLWEPLLEAASRSTGAAPAPVLRLGLARAAGHDRIGETVLLSLLALGAGGPAAADPVTLLAVMRGLAAVGLGDEAWALAVDAVAASP